MGLFWSWIVLVCSCLRREIAPRKMFDIAPEKCPFKKFDDDGRTLRACFDARRHKSRGAPRWPTSQRARADHAEKGNARRLCEQR
eukprot:COSAG06_NODE_112_length_23474_cov_81.804458_18_plen_85_part_00